jgi:hypothetical protein
MEVPNQRADVARAVLLRVLALALPDGVDVRLQPLWPIMEACVIHTVDLAPLWNFDVGVSQQELST